MIDAPLALAFTAGLVATVNPCGFAMLPAYLSWYLGSDTQTRQSIPLGRRLGRALAVGTRVSVGFLIVFGTAGALITAGVRSFIDYVPWLALVIGLALAALGVALVAGKHLTVALPKPRAGAGTLQTRSMVAFGASYAVASLSCTLPVFLAVVSATFTRTSLASGVATFAAYALGMSAVLLTVTVSLALAQHTLIARVRALTRHVNRLAGALLILAGGYIVYYWAFNLTTNPGETTGAGPLRLVERISATATTWLQHLGWQSAALALGATITGAAILAIRDRRPDGPTRRRSAARHQPQPRRPEPLPNPRHRHPRLTLTPNRPAKGPDMPTPSIADLRTTWTTRPVFSNRAVDRAAIALLADGEPATADALAVATGMTTDQITTYIAAARDRGIEVEDGAIVGAALTLRPTGHRFRVRGNNLYTWCGYDALFLPIMLGERAEVASTCPVTGAEIKLTVQADGTVSHAEPASVVVGIVGHDITSCCPTTGPQSAVCTQMPLFASRDAAEHWLTGHPGVAIVDLDDAAEVARAYVESR